MCQGLTCLHRMPKRALYRHAICIATSACPYSLSLLLILLLAAHAYTTMSLAVGQATCEPAIRRTPLHSIGIHLLQHASRHLLLLEKCWLTIALACCSACVLGIHMHVLTMTCLWVHFHLQPAMGILWWFCWATVTLPVLPRHACTPRIVQMLDLMAFAILV